MNEIDILATISICEIENISEGTIYYEACENSFEIEQCRLDKHKYGLNSILYHPHHPHLLNSNPNTNNSLLLSLNSFSISDSKDQFMTTSNDFSQEIHNKKNYLSPIHSSKKINDNNLFHSNSINENITQFFPLKISTIDFKLNLDQIDLTFLKLKRRVIPIKTHKLTDKNRNCHTLIELQNFYLSNQPIWAFSFSHDGNYLAIGTRQGFLYILEMINYASNDFQSSYNESDIMNYLNFINERPKRVYNEHSEDIIDLSWSPHIKTQLLTASLDHYVILWDITIESSILKFQHDGIATCVAYHPIKPHEFASGSLDKIIRLWSIDYSNSNATFDYFNIKEKVMALTYSPNGESISVGTHNGKIIIYDLLPKLLYNCSFSCRNRIGKNSLGKKVTCIEFCDKNTALISTGDSRIRLMTIPEGKMIQKYKGHKNEEGIMRGHCDNMNDLIISPSEDGNVFLWNKYNKNTDARKNYGCEYFKAFGNKEIVQVARIPSDICAANYIKKIYKITNKIFVSTLIVTCTDKGRMQVILNVEETK